MNYQRPSFNNRVQVDTFYSNGKLKTSGDLVDGVRQGLWYSYYPNGYLKMFENYEKGILHGTQRKYNQEFEILEETKFLMGKVVDH